MERVIIIGPRGAGKSTLANNLSKITGLPALHLDRLYWNQEGESLSIAAFDKLLAEEIKKEQWIIDGNYIRAMNAMVTRCDTVIFLDYSRLSCLFGVISRALKGTGWHQANVAEGYSGRLDFTFLKHVWRTADKNRQRYHEMLQNVEDTQVVILKHRRACRRFLEEISK